MNDSRLTGKSWWRVVEPIPAPHPEMNPIPVGAVVIAQTRIGSPIIVLKREKPSDNFYDTHVTTMLKDEMNRYLEVEGANIRWKGNDDEHS